MSGAAQVRHAKAARAWKRASATETAAYSAWQFALERLNGTWDARRRDAREKEERRRHAAWRRASAAENVAKTELDEARALAARETVN